MMIGLQEIYFNVRNIIKLNRFVNQIFYITELNLWDIDEMIDLLKFLTNKQQFDFEATSKDEENLKLSRSPLQFLFQNYDISSIKKLIIREFSIDNSDVKALCNLLSLIEFNIYCIKFKNISFSELFCANQEYKIKKMKLSQINISQKDLIFIENLKKIRVIIFWSCNIQGNTYESIRMCFYNEFYVELRYYREDDNLSEGTINLLKRNLKRNILL
ncbi:hypothetical protein CWI39_3461p0010 [Hamiltosporidium magnivora]|uniref:Uncharacterized protein n=1 Tax=Hamiltosporidium magnivora TaxID=148818 RepID=A0A4Q9KQ22_9MICR|nr:hypothetical protein CWI39_3461p0010 [Hamiltosporidium magnivora]